jgi:hypothetical protein
MGAYVNLKHLAKFFLVEKVSDRSCRENYNTTHVSYQAKIFRQSYSLQNLNGKR